MNVTHQILIGDNLQIMRAMPDKSVDLVFTSPPYEAARTYGIDFALKGQDWVDWAVERFVECLRVCRGLVAWNVEGQTRAYRYSATPALLMADLHRRGVHLRKPPIFHRVGIPGSGGPDWFRNDYEFIVCAGPGGKLPWSNNTAMGHPPKWGPGGEMSNRLGNGRRVNQWGKSPGAVTNRKRDGSRNDAARPSHVETLIDNCEPEPTEPLPFGDKTGCSSRAPDGSRNGNGFGGSRLGRGQDLKGSTGAPMPVLANPGNVIKCNVGGGAMGSELAHENEAPFPEKLAEWFVLSCCPPGGTVLDPHCGSGTTLAVALKHGRNAIGIDVRESQVELTRRRIAESVTMFHGGES